MVTHYTILNVTNWKPEVTEACFNWCQEQGLIYQSNLDISNLGVVAIAMVALVLYNISVEWSDEICKATKINSDALRFFGHSIVFFAFTLLAGFLIYYSIIN